MPWLLCKSHLELQTVKTIENNLTSVDLTPVLQLWLKYDWIFLTSPLTKICLYESYIVLNSFVPKQKGGSFLPTPFPECRACSSCNLFACLLISNVKGRTIGIFYRQYKNILSCLYWDSGFVSHLHLSMFLELYQHGELWAFATGHWTNSTRRGS